VELLGELVGAYEAETAVRQAIATRLLPHACAQPLRGQASSADAAGAALMALCAAGDDARVGSFAPTQRLPLSGLPLSAEADRDHLTLLAAAAAVKPMMDAQRLAQVMEALELLAKADVATA
jgi:hypothetical protein